MQNLNRQETLRLPVEQLIAAAHVAAKYLPAASSALMTELAVRLDVTKTVLREVIAERDQLNTEHKALKQSCGEAM